MPAGKIVPSSRRSPDSLRRPVRIAWVALVALAFAAVAVAALFPNGGPLAAGPLAAGRPSPDRSGSDRAAGMASPAYDAEGRLLLPEDYRTWVFVGSSLGLSYSEGELSHEMFHHTLMEPSAYRHYTRTGEFREGTMLVLMLHGTGEGVLPGRQGRFANEIHGVEMAVKDSARFEEGWAYYAFGGMGGVRDRAEAFAKENCYACHVEHAAKDNVFLQFYPLLAEAAPTETAAAHHGTPVVGETAERTTEGPGGESVADDLPPLAFGGLDPVLLAEGREEEGKPEIVMVHGGLSYRFLVEPTRARFAARPELYEAP